MMNHRYNDIIIIITMAWKWTSALCSLDKHSINWATYFVPMNQFLILTLVLKNTN